MSFSKNNAGANFPAACSFRPMRKEDIPDLAGIDRLSNSPAWNEAMFLRELELPFSRSRVAALARAQTGPESKEELLIAFGVLWAVAGVAQIQELAVDPEYRRQGVGRRLLIHLLEIAKKESCQTAELELRNKNDDALALYKSLGFFQTQERKNFYPDSDAILMTCDLKTFSSSR